MLLIASAWLASPTWALQADTPQHPEIEGRETDASAPANNLFVGCTDGSLQCLALVGGVPTERAVAIDLKEPLRFLAHHPALPIVYALGDEHLIAVRWDAVAGTFAVLGQAKVGVRGTHVALDPAARWALVASYGEGAVSCLPLSEAGLPQPPVSRLGGPDDSRLAKAHQVCWHPQGEVAYVPALGADHVAILRVDPSSGALEWAGSAGVPEGTGPRHMALHPSQPWAYVLGEHSSTITSFALDPQGIAWNPLGQTLNLAKGSTEPGSRSSDIHISASGELLFAINREPADDITAYAIDDQGALQEVSRRSTGGRHARTFALDPQGKHLWIGNTRSKNVVTLGITADGVLGNARSTWQALADITCVLPALHPQALRPRKTLTKDAEIARRTKVALKAISDTVGTEAGEYGADLFAVHHLEELDATYWVKWLQTKNPTTRQVLSILTLCDHWSESDEEGLDTLDFTLPGEVTDYVISVRFDRKGNVEDISMES